MESGNSGPALEYLREVEKTEAVKARGKTRLGGLIMLAVGAGLMIFMAAVIKNAPVYLVGLIPLLIGVALLVYSEFVMKSPE